MEALYVIGMVAVSVLCLALLSTARRILRSSPLSNNDFGTTRMYEVARAEEESDEMNSAHVLSAATEATQFESTLVLDEPLLLESVASEAVAAETFVAQTHVATLHYDEDFHSIAASVEPSVESEPPRAGKWGRLPKPTRQTYNYVFECLLIGISAYALFKAQRDTMRYRSVPAAASRDRVA